MTKASLKKNATVEKLRVMLAQAGPHDLIWYHRLGGHVQKLFPRQEERKYGQSYVTKIVAAIGSTSYKKTSLANLLWHARNFADQYVRDEVKSLNGPTTNGFRVSWTHVKQLLSVESSERKRVERQCLKNEWSASELQRYVTGGENGKKSMGGRSPRAPKNLRDGLNQLISENEGWLRKCREAWFGGKRPLTTDIRTTDDLDRLPELFERANELLSDMACEIEEAQLKLKQQGAYAKQMRSKAMRSSAKRKKSTKKA